MTDRITVTNGRTSARIPASAAEFWESRGFAAEKPKPTRGRKPAAPKEDAKEADE